MTKFYTYWEGDRSPKYLHLCIASWFKHIPDLDLTVINHGNLNNWVGDTYDIDGLKTFSLPMQSDAVSAAVLARHGGLFIDCDTILTRRPDEFLTEASGNAIKCFGIPQNNRFHVAVLGVGKPYNPIAMRWMTEVAARIETLPSASSWNFLGGDILDPLLDSGTYRKSIEIVDRKSSGNILESYFDFGKGQGKASYEDLYFNPNNVALEEALARARDGIISLHNSWTPRSYSTLATHKEVLDQGNLLSKILSEVAELDLARHVEEYYL